MPGMLPFCHINLPPQHRMHGDSRSLHGVHPPNHNHQRHMAAVRVHPGVKPMRLPHLLASPGGKLTNQERLQTPGIWRPDRRPHPHRHGGNLLNHPRNPQWA